MSPANQSADPRRALRPGLGTFFSTLAELFEQWRLVLGIPFLCMVLAAVWVLLAHPTYRAIATFIVDSDQGQLRMGTGLSGLVSQLGLPVAGGGQSPAFFADLATSREVLLAVAGTRYPAPGDRSDSTVSLRDLYHFPPLDTPQGVALAVKRLAGDVKANVDPETGLISVQVDAREPRLAAAIADTLLSALNRFNLDRRQLRSRALRRFLESRLQDARDDLERTEDSVRLFREHNRTFAQSPELQLQDQRLQRAVELRQSLYVSLATSYEQARMEEYRDTPSLTIVDPPRPPFDKVKPKRRLVVAGAGLLGLLIGLAMALMRHSLVRLDNDELAAWDAAKSAAQRLPIVRTLNRR